MTDEELDALLNSGSGLMALESVLDASVASDVIGKVLKADKTLDLAKLLADSEKQLSQAQETFMDIHCGQLDRICELYREVTSCEARLKEFEDDIAHFQGSLTTTAEEIVRMQTGTMELVGRINNRKAVSLKLKEVYEALNECDAFCEHIATAQSVDAEFLKSIRQLESRIAFLADNAELENSEVHSDFHPKLEAAALRAGDKLHRFLLKKLQSLGEEHCNVALHQQAIERQGQYAYAFLSRYNEPIAADILNQYIRLMSDVYIRQMKPIGKAVLQICSATSAGTNSTGSKSGPSIADSTNDAAVRDLLVPNDLFVQLGGHKRAPSLAPLPQQAGIPRSNALMNFLNEAKGQSAGPGQSQARAGSRSISTSLGLAFDKLRGKVPERREATFADNCLALRSIDVTYRLVAVDPTIGVRLEGTTCWVHRFSELYCRLVNNVINEGRFVDHFFFSAGATTEQEEYLLHCILDGHLETALHIVLSEIPSLHDPIGILCAKRALELFKNYVTQSADPLPIMVMADLFDRIGAALTQKLDQLLAASSKSLDDVAKLRNFKPFAPLSADAARKPIAEVVAHDALLAGNLAPPDMVRRYADVSCQFQLVNTMMLEGSRVGGGFDRAYFDDATNAHLSATLESLFGIIERLSARHPGPLTATVAEVNALGHLALQMAHAEDTYMQDVLSHSSFTPPEPRSPTRVASIRGSSRPPGSPTTDNSSMVEANPAMLTSQQMHAISGGLAVEPAKLSHVVGTPQYAAVLARLKTTTAKFVHLDTSANNNLAPFMDMVGWAVRTFGDDFFVASAPGAPPLGPVDLPSTAPSEAELLTVLANFNKGWQAALQRVAEGVKVLFPERKGELATFVLREYFGQIVVANNRARCIVERGYPKSQVLKTKLVGNVVISHEVAKYFHTQQPSSGN
jgi:hypothetical protein